MKRLIAIPCFNEEESISKCLDSLIKTNILDDKTSILVVNDGSEDRTLEILESYKNDVKIISSKTNFGLSEVFNSIMNYGKSKNYDQLVIFDSDYQLFWNGEPHILTCTIAFFEKKNKGKVPRNFQPCSGQVLITDISVYKHFLAS